MPAADVFVLGKREQWKLRREKGGKVGSIKEKKKILRFSLRRKKTESKQES